MSLLFTALFAFTLSSPISPEISSGLSSELFPGISTLITYDSPASNEPALVASADPAAPVSILVPIEEVSTPQIKSLEGSYDAFDTSNATVCWKRKRCGKVRLSQKEIDILQNSYFLDEHIIPNFPVDEYRTKCKWVECPAAMPVSCGLGCAVSKEHCHQDIYQQVSSVAEVAFNVGQIILAVIAPGTGVSILHSSVLKNWLAQAGERLAVQALKYFITAKISKAAADQLADQIIGAANGKNSSIDWSMADPTGVTDVVKTFWKPMCALPESIATPILLL